MGNPKLKWTREEEDALRRGVAKHGAGKWKNIHQDPEFGPALSSRSNIDLKDKWRNLGVASGQITRDKSKLKSKAKNVRTSSPMIVASTTTTTEVHMSEDRAHMMDEPLSARKQPNRGAITDFKEIKTEELTKRESRDLITLTTEEKAFLWVASRVAEAEHISAVADESMREAERVSAMAEESEALLQFARNCLDSSMLGDVLLMS